MKLNRRSTPACDSEAAAGAVEKKKAAAEKASEADSGTFDLLDDSWIV